MKRRTSRRASPILFAGHTMVVAVTPITITTITAAKRQTHLRLPQKRLSQIKRSIDHRRVLLPAMHNIRSLKRPFYLRQALLRPHNSLPTLGHPHPTKSSSLRLVLRPQQATLGQTRSSHLAMQTGCLSPTRRNYPHLPP